MLGSMLRVRRLFFCKEGKKQCEQEPPGECVIIFYCLCRARVLAFSLFLIDYTPKEDFRGSSSKGNSVTSAAPYMLKPLPKRFTNSVLLGMTTCYDIVYSIPHNLF